MNPFDSDPGIQLPAAILNMSSAATFPPYSPYGSPTRSPLRVSSNPTDEAIKLATQLATDIILDRQLKPKRPAYRYNELPPPFKHNSKAIEDLRAKYRRILCTLIQRIQQTFGPNATSYSDPKRVFTEFIAECKKVNTICEPTSAMSLITAFQNLDLLYKKFTAWLNIYYNALMTTELSLRFKLAKKNGAQVSRRHSNNFYFFKETFYMFYLDDSGKTVHKVLKILPITEENLRQRLLEESLQRRYGHTDRFTIHTILCKQVERYGTPSNSLHRLVAALKDQYRGSNLNWICNDIDEQAKIIIRRFGPDYFFDDKSTFTEYLPLWAHRYCKLAELFEKGNMGADVLVRKVRSRLLDMLYFLEVSHAALLEKDVDNKIQSVVDLLSPDLTFSQAFGQKFTVWRGEVVMKSALEDNCRENLDILVRDIKSLQFIDESLNEPDNFQEDNVPRASRKDLLADDEMTDKEYNSESEINDEMFPQLEDTILLLSWNTKPEKVKLAPHVSLKHCVPEVTSGLEPSSSQSPPVDPPQKHSRGRPRKNQTETSNLEKVDSAFSSAISSPAVSPKRKTIRPTKSRPGSPSAPTGTQKAAAKNATSKTNKIPSTIRGGALQVDEHPNRERIMYEKSSGEVDRDSAGEARSPQPSKYLNDQSISVSAFLPQPTRPASPYFAPAPDLARHIADETMSDELTQPLLTDSEYQRGFLTLQILDELLCVEFGNGAIPYPPRKHDPAREDDEPLDPDWASKPMPPPSVSKSRGEWTLNYRAKPDMVADIEFIRMIDRTYD